MKNLEEPNTNEIALCTIINSNYLHYALALFESLKQQNSQFKFFIGLSNKYTKENTILKEKNITVLQLKDVCSEIENADQIVDLYFEKDDDRFRWCSKSVLLQYLLKNKNYEKAFFLDPDLFFVNEFNFLSERLDEYNILLTPHWRTIQPEQNKTEFTLLFKHGLFNAGFIGVNNKAMDFLKWWLKANIYACESSLLSPLHDDQKYLDVVPIYFDKVKIIKHQGCNVAYWNLEECKRSIDAQQNVLINDTYKLIFIHFSAKTKQFILEKDKTLLPFLNAWEALKTKYAKFFEINNFEKFKMAKQNRINQFVKKIIFTLTKRFKL